MIAVGIATCFYGGKLFDHLVYAIPALFAFYFVFLVLTNFMSGWALAIVGIIVPGAAAAGVGYLAYKTKTIAMAILGGVAGFFLGFFLFALVFSLFLTSQFFLYLTLIVTTAFGAFAIFKYQEKVELHATVFIGAYLIIRGISNFLGGFPEEEQLFFMLRNGNFSLGLAFYGYLVVFIVLNVAGTWFQYHMGFDENMPTKREKGANNGDYEKAQPLSQQ